MSATLIREEKRARTAAELEQLDTPNVIRGLLRQIEYYDRRRDETKAEDRLNREQGR